MCAFGDALGEAVRPAGVVGDVAADRARLLAARVGREVQAVARRRRGDRSRLSTPGSTHARRAAGSTDRIRFIFVVDDDHRAVGRHGAAGQAGARAAGDERHAVATGDARRTPAPRRSTSGSTRPTAAPSMCEASWRYSDSSVAPSRTRSARERVTQRSDELGAARVIAAHRLAPSSRRRSRMTRADSTARRRRAARRRVEVVAEAHQATVALGDAARARAAVRRRHALLARRRRRAGDRAARRRAAPSATLLGRSLAAAAATLRLA